MTTNTDIIIILFKNATTMNILLMDADMPYVLFVNSGTANFFVHDIMVAISLFIHAEMAFLSVQPQCISAQECHNSFCSKAKQVLWS